MSIIIYYLIGLYDSFCGLFKRKSGYEEWKKNNKQYEVIKDTYEKYGSDIVDLVARNEYRYISKHKDKL